MKFKTPKHVSINDEALVLSAMVDAFASEMKAKLHRKLVEPGWKPGTSHLWDQPDKLSDDDLVNRLKEQVSRADIDPVDVANYAAFLWNRE